MSEFTHWRPCASDYDTVRKCYVVEAMLSHCTFLEANIKTLFQSSFSSPHSRSYTSELGFLLDFGDIDHLLAYLLITYL